LFAVDAEEGLYDEGLGYALSRIRYELGDAASNLLHNALTCSAVGRYYFAEDFDIEALWANMLDSAKM
jgi:hypothetical protein